MDKHIYNLKKDAEDERDYLFKNLIKDKTIELPNNVDLRDKMPTVFSQNQEGSCTAQTGVADREYLEYVQNGKKVILSRQYLYNKERINDGTLSEDSGSSMRQICDTLLKNGCAEESYLTYGNENLKVIPSAEADENAAQYKISSYHRVVTNDEIKQALAQGLPVLCGINVYSSFESVGSDGNIPVANVKTEELLGGHATLLCGYSNNLSMTTSQTSWIQMIINFICSLFGKTDNAKSNVTKFILRNSWGKSIKNNDGSSWGYAFNNPSDSGFGDHGYGYLTEESLNAIKQDCWVIVK